MKSLRAAEHRHRHAFDVQHDSGGSGLRRKQRRKCRTKCPREMARRRFERPCRSSFQSSSVRSIGGHAKCHFNARMTRSAFSCVGLTQMSMSPVARAIPWAASAWAPTTRNSAPASESADNISAKSRFTEGRLLELPRLHGQRPHERNARGGAEVGGCVMALVAERRLADRIVRSIAHRSIITFRRRVRHTISARGNSIPRHARDALGVSKSRRRLDQIRQRRASRAASDTSIPAPSRISSVSAPSAGACRPCRSISPRATTCGSTGTC